MQNPPRDERTLQRRLAALEARLRALETTPRLPSMPAYTADHTAGTGDDVMEVSAASGNVTITLPTVVGSAGKSFEVKRTDSTTANTVTVAAQSGETIDGASTYTQLWAQYAWLRVTSDGSGWLVRGQSLKPEPYQSPSFGSGWASGPSSGTVLLLKYWRDGFGNVQLNGSCHSTSATPAATIFTLPALYRPATTVRLEATENSGGTATAHYLEVNSSGAVSISTNFAASGHDLYIDTEFPLA